MKTDTLVQELTDSFGDWFLPGCKNPAGGAAKMTQNLYPYDSIFSPIRVNRLTIEETSPGVCALVFPKPAACGANPTCDPPRSRPIDCP